VQILAMASAMVAVCALYPVPDRRACLLFK